jgi:hypothetical protein
VKTITKENVVSTETILLLILIVLAVGAIPSWGHSRNWGYGPSGILGLVVVVFLIWALAGNRPLFRNNTGSSVGTAVQDVGHDVKKMGRDAADSVRDAVN